VDDDELAGYVGQFIVLMVARLPSVRTLWATNGITVDYPGKSRGLSHHRFRWLYAHLTFDSKTLHDILNDTFSHHITPGTHMTVDESRKKAHPRSPPDATYVVPNPMKPDRYALEAITFCSHNGLLFYISDPFDTSNMTVTEKVVEVAQRLCSSPPVPHLVADRRFGSYKLASTLDSMGVRFTMNCKRNAPSFLFANHLLVGIAHGETRVAAGENMVAIASQTDSRHCLLSNAFTAHPSETPIPQTERRGVWDLYRGNNRRVDIFNQLLKAYQNPHKHMTARGCWLDMVMSICLTQGYLLHKETSMERLSHKQFLLAVSSSLLDQGWEQ